MHAIRIFVPLAIQSGNGFKKISKSPRQPCTIARFLLFFYSIDIDRLEVDLGYICDRDPNFSKGVTVELE